MITYQYLIEKLINNTDENQVELYCACNDINVNLIRIIQSEKDLIDYLSSYPYSYNDFSLKLMIYNYYKYRKSSFIEYVNYADYEIIMTSINDISQLFDYSYRFLKELLVYLKQGIDLSYVDFTQYDIKQFDLLGLSKIQGLDFDYMDPAHYSYELMLEILSLSDDECDFTKYDLRDFDEKLLLDLKVAIKNGIDLTHVDLRYLRETDLKNMILKSFKKDETLI